MNPGDCFQRSWIPAASELKQTLHDTLWIYDGGNIQGFLLERQGKQDWFLFQIESREYDTEGRIHESGLVLSDDNIPQHFFAIESYPTRCIIQGKTYIFVLPTTQVTITLSSPQKSQYPQQQPLPSPYPLQHQLPSQPVLPAPPKSVSHRPSQQQRTPQHKSRVGPKQTSSPSSNQVSHAQPKRQAQELPVRRPPRQSAMSRNAPKSQSSLPQSSQFLPSPSSHTHPTQA